MLWIPDMCDGFVERYWTVSMFFGSEWGRSQAGREALATLICEHRNPSELHHPGCSPTQASMLDSSRLAYIAEGGLEGSSKGNMNL